MAEATWPRVAIVTGAGGGLGRAIAHVLGANGVACALVGRRRSALEATAAAAPHGGDTVVVPADVSVADDRARIVASTVDRFGRIDVLVNNAGVAIQEHLFAQSLDGWRTTMAVNVEAAFFLAQSVLPTMRQQRRGRVINIASVYGSLACNTDLYPGQYPDDPNDGPLRQIAYHASKGALINLTRELAVAAAPWGITVNAISPGMFITEASDAMRSSERFDETVAAITAMTPLGRYGEPREIGHAVRFLASSEADFITGIDLVVDGGWSLW
jgi:NAD(P)-dependent dehydrogenase (short-subunit alcohol dehydrogenase family)